MSDLAIDLVKAMVKRYVFVGGDTVFIGALCSPKRSVIALTSTTSVRIGNKLILKGTRGLGLV